MADTKTPAGNGRAPAPEAVRRIRHNWDLGPASPIQLQKAARGNISALGNGVDPFEEYGRTGLRHWGGFLFEEWLQQLQQDRRAAEVFREMVDGDPIIGGIDYAIQGLLRRVSWWFEPAKSKEADLANGMLHDMADSWEDTLGSILSFIRYGYDIEEFVLKRRAGYKRDPALSSKFNDGLVGVSKLATRSQDSNWKWVFNDVGETVGYIQNPPPDYLLRFIPREKYLHFRTTTFKDNPSGRSLYRSAYSCFDPETQLLTERGWAPVAEVEMTDSLATLNDIGVIEYHRPTHLHAYDFQGEMVHVTGAFLDQKVTPNHNLYVKPQKASSGYQLVEAQKAKPTHRFKMTGEWLAPDVDDYEVPAWVDGNGKLWPKHRVAMDDWVRFLGIYLAEGSTYRGRQRLVTVSQNVGEKADTIQEWMEAVGFPVCRYDTAVKAELTFTRGQMYEVLDPLGKARDKRVPAYVKTLSRRQIRIFLDAYHYGDGTIIGTCTPVIYTSSDQMADDLMELAIKAGYESRIRWQRATGFGLNGKGKGGVWIVTLGQVRPNGRRGTNWDKVPYEGKVYCVTVENHTVLARRNGKACWSGNSWYFCRNLKAIEGIGMERDACGIPVMTPPEGTDIWDTNDPDMAGLLQQAKNAVSSIRRDEQEGIVKPFGWTLELLASGGSRQIDISAAIRRYQWDMATSVLADILMMGQSQVGSYALAVTKKDVFALQMGALLDIVASVFNKQLWPRIWALNGMPQETLPKMCHGQVETLDVDTIGNFFFRIAAAGAPIDWRSSLPWLNDQVGVPQPPEDHDFSPRVVGRGQGTQNGNGQSGAGVGPHSDTAAASTLTTSTPVAKAEDFSAWRDHLWEGAV